jgi:outer membrane protein assembly factor BamA
MCAARLGLGAAPALCAQTSQARGFEVAGVPAISFDSDEGFGYGAIVELYHYDAGSVGPYAWTVQPSVILSTRGRRDFTLFFDAPGLLPAGWRLDAFVGLERQIASPYYGIGNDTRYDAVLDDADGPDPFYYRFGRRRASLTANVQRELAGPRLRALVGAGLVRTTVDPFPRDEGGTLYAAELGPVGAEEWSNYVRGGLIWDTRDRESGPRRGAWTELLVQRVDRTLGADASYTRWTFTDRRYFSLTPDLVLAHRWLVQGVGSDVFVPDLFRVQTSFKQQEGLGGSKTIRGLPKNRYAGRSMFVWNAELRWRAADFTMAGRAFYVALSGFLDQGRVWQGRPRLDEIFADLHRGYGGGVRLGMGENFVLAVDAGTSRETGLPIYMGLGYLY